MHSEASFARNFVGQLCIVKIGGGPLDLCPYGLAYSHLERGDTGGDGCRPIIQKLDLDLAHGAADSGGQRGEQAPCVAQLEAKQLITGRRMPLEAHSDGQRYLYLARLLQR